MTETKLPTLPPIAATVAFITAAVVLITALLDVYLMPPASNGSATVAASMFAFPIMFLAGGILLLKRAYTDRSLGGSAICLFTDPQASLGDWVSACPLVLTWSFR